ncbi:MAG: 16S rRNA (uracil(1498)-N(3))-methyltransferase [Rickettsiales bacterium]|jgi:16S rRNA (uracil1498-N3)-methyltransferase|nr:16S rRNA (uracil(1498)-N(3))-methyltransferase [Rickettsiales bacterium]
MVRVHVEDISPRLELKGADFHYLHDVMRLGPGGAVNVFNEADGEFGARVSEVSRRSVVLDVGGMVRGPESESLQDIGLAFSPIRHARQDFMVEHATELGAMSLSPVVMERSQVRAFNAGRAREIARQASEQSRRLSVPEVLSPVRFADFMAGFDFKSRRLVFLDERPSAKRAPMPPAPATFLVGPEGGFSEAEFAALDASPAVGISLGPLVLRSETAALAALAAYGAGAR